MFRGATRFVLVLGIAVFIGHTSAVDARSAHFRGVTVDALATLNDIGGMADKAAPFSISPDKSQLAVVVRTADPAGNTYRQEIVVVDIGSGAVVRRAALPGEPRLQLNAEGNPIGTLETIIPQWSADGKCVYFLLAKDGVAQIMEFPVEEGSLRQTTHFSSSIADFKVLPDGNHLQVRYFDAGGRAKEGRPEAREGYRYDERWKPTVSNRPLPAPPKTKTTLVAIATGDPVPLTAQGNDAQSDQPRDTVSTYGRATIEAVNPEFLNSPVRVSVRTAQGQRKTCPDSDCSNADAIWWGTDAATLLIKRRTGWAESVTEIVAWKPRERKTHVLLNTDDRVSGCGIGKIEIICAVDGSAQPRRLIALNQKTGAPRVLFDPNPDWHEMRTGTIRRLHWKNDLGLEVIGDLVLPPETPDKQKLPLVVVGYTTIGFLRGGTGDLVPILPLAEQGFAVLSIQNPMDVGLLAPVRNWDAATRAHFNNWADRRSASDAIVKGIDLALQTGQIDRERIGITGFSNGSENARFAIMQHPELFKAAALFTCCDDPVSSRIALGPTLAGRRKNWGYPALELDAPVTPVWPFAAKARDIDVPLLLQVADREYLFALETFSAFSEAGKCVEMYVFPDEYHVLWQSAHRRAAYQRTIDWFRRYLGVKSKPLAINVEHSPDLPPVESCH
jgi:dipeptidyl aminopeptidase/acylaminoacyl peptidase